MSCHCSCWSCVSDCQHEPKHIQISSLLLFLPSWLVVRTASLDCIDATKRFLSSLEVLLTMTVHIASQMHFNALLNQCIMQPNTTLPDILYYS